MLHRTGKLNKAFSSELNHSSVLHSMKRVKPSSDNIIGESQDFKFWEYLPYDRKNLNTIPNMEILHLV